MKKENFTPLHITLNVAALLVAVYATLHWSAFMAIRKAATDLAPTLQSTCQAVRGCNRIKAGYRWSGTDKEYVSEAVVMQNRMSATDKAFIESSIHQAFDQLGYRTVAFGPLIKAVQVRYENE